MYKTLIFNEQFLKFLAKLLGKLLNMRYLCTVLIN
jgi:hypothetical protein